MLEHVNSDTEHWSVLSDLLSSTIRQDTTRICTNGWKV